MPIEMLSGVDQPSVRVGGEILVNSATDQDQKDQKITGLQGGGFVVTWMDDSQSNGGAPGDMSYSAIKAQLFNPDGTPLGGEFLVNSTTTFRQEKPQVTSLDGGGFLILWNDASGYSDTGWDQRAQLYDASGARVGGEILVHTPNNWNQGVDSDQYDGRASALPGGGFVIVWNDARGDDGPGAWRDSAVRAQLFDAAGTKQGDEILVNTVTEGQQFRAQVATLDGGGFAVTWAETTDAVYDENYNTIEPNKHRVKVQLFEDDGDRIGGEIVLTTASGGDQTKPLITGLADGNFVVTWVDMTGTADGDNNAVLSQVFARNGSPLTGIMVVNQETPSSQDEPQVAALADGGFVVTWRDDSPRLTQAQGPDGYTDIKARVFDNNGAPVTNELLVNSEVYWSQAEPQIAALATGGFAIAWTDTSRRSADDDMYAVKAQEFSADGSRVGAELLVNSAYLYGQDKPQIAALPYGGFAIAWSDFSQGFGNGATGDSSRLAVKAQVFWPPNLYIGTPNPDVFAATDGYDWRIYGRELGDILTGAAGNDQISGGSGADTMAGKAGNDRYIVDDAGDQVLEADGEGNDRVEASVTFSLAGQYAEQLRLTGTGDIDGTGNALANQITGNSGANRLDGGAGADILRGGLGNDTYVVGAGDSILEYAGEGDDTVESAVSWSLAGQYLERLVLTGTAAINGRGNNLDNVIVGNSAANLLNGEGGADRMEGGAGNDRYVVDHVGDVVVEADAAGGTDHVESAIAYTLGDNVENLTLTGGASIRATGNALANLIVGNNGSNLIDGGAGADRMEGGAGNDRYIVDNVLDRAMEVANEGNDTVEAWVSYSLAGQYVETLRLMGDAALNGSGNNQANSIFGNGAANAINAAAGDDKLYGKGGHDLLTGGAGADRFVFDSALDAATNVDTIADFSAADDAIYLDRSVFRAFASGTIAASAFASGSAAADADDRIVYDSATGNIFYDADGSGAGAAILFANVGAGTMVTHADFIAF